MKRLILFSFCLLAGCSQTEVEVPVRQPSDAGKIHHYIRDGNVAGARNLIEANPKSIAWTDDYDRTPLHIAARFSTPEMVTYLLKKGANPNATAYNRFTPLHVCTSPKSATTLIRSGSKTEAVDAWGNTPLQGAARLDRKGLCEAMIKAGSRLDIVSALYLKKRTEVLAMVQQDPSVVKEHVGTSGLWNDETPLGIAAGRGDLELVKLFLRHGAPVNGGTNRPNVGVFTPLCNAVWGKHHDVAECLLKNGATVEVSGGKFFDTIIDYAEEHSDEKMQQLLQRAVVRRGQDE